MNAARLLLVDDHPVVRSSIRNLLDGLSDVAVVGEAGDGSEALSQAEALAPDIIILDIELPNMNGVDVTRELKRRKHPAKILVLSAHDDAEYIQEIFSIGVSGYVVKDEASEVIVDAVRGVVHGEDGWISQRVVSQMMRAVQGEVKLHSDFTGRESRVLELIVEGKTNSEIAYLLGISEKTVEKYVFSILSKLNVSSRVEAAVIAIRRGWL